MAMQGISAGTLSVLLTGIGLVILIGLSLMYLRRRDGGGRGAGAEQRRALESVMADAEELGERLAGMLDTKAARLERLIAEADQRLARLERTQQVEARPRAEDPLNRRIYDLADRGLAPVEIARELSQQVGQVELVLALRRG